MVGGLVMSPAGAPPSDQVLAEAAAWLVRLQSEARSAADVAAFQAWAAADPSHGAAFEAVSGTWDITGGIPRDMRGRERAHPVSRRRALVAAGGAVLAVGAGIGYLREAAAGAYQTEIGEQKHITLKDGSRI